MAHGHEHGHGGHSQAAPRREVLLLVMLAGFVVTSVEVVAAFAADSLVLLADAAHYLTDLVGLGLAYAAVTFAMRPATLRKTFGYHRAEVVAAFVNAILLWGLSAYLAYEAFERIRAPRTVEGLVVIGVGAFTLVANAGMAYALHRHAGRNLNMRAAFLHIVSDALGSAVALLAGLLVHFYGLHVADPLLTLFVTFLIVVFTWRLTSQSLHILLEGAPEHLDAAAIERSLREVDHVTGVHDLHVWSLTSGVESLSVHVVLDCFPGDERVVAEVHRRLHEDFGVRHVTVQVEGPGPCPSPPCEAPADATPSRPHRNL